MPLYSNLTAWDDWNERLRLRKFDLSIDTSTAAGRLMFTMIGAIARFERPMMRERQPEDIVRAKVACKYKG